MRLTHRSPGRARARWCAVAAIGMLAHGLAAGRLAGQTPDSTVVLAGVVADFVTGDLLSGARVEVVGLGTVVFTELEGEFSVDVPVRSEYTLLVEHFGYESNPFTAPASALVGSEPVFALTPAPVTLDGLRVEAVSAFTEVLTQHELRRRSYPWGSVRRMRRDRLLRSAAPSVRDLLREVMNPGVYVCNTDVIGDLCLPGTRQSAVGLVCIDDVRALGRAADLMALDPEEVFSVDVFGGGSTVLVYTLDYMAGLRTRPPRINQPFADFAC